VTNWAGNVVFRADGVHRPRSTQELQALVAGNRKVRVLSGGHSFTDIADTAGALVSLAGLPPSSRSTPSPGRSEYDQPAPGAKFGRCLIAMATRCSEDSSRPRLRWNSAGVSRSGIRSWV
jgi:hypothetical protein